VKPRDAAAVLFGLKFAHKIHYKFKSSQASKARLQSCKRTSAKQNLTQNGDSRSFKVTYFGVSGKTTFLPLIAWVYLHSNCRGWLRKYMYFETVPNGRSRLSKVIDFGTNQKRVCNFPLVLNSKLGHILHRSEILQVFCSEQRPHPYSTRILELF